MKLKLKTFGGKTPLIYATNKCQHITIYIIIYKSVDFKIFFLYNLCFIYRFYSINFYIFYATKVSISIISTPTIFMSMKLAFL